MGEVLDVEVNNNIAMEVIPENEIIENETLETPVSDTVVDQQVTKLNEDGEYDITELVEAGPRGVTNQGMIPALKKYIAEGNKKALETLKACFAEVVESSLKYLGKKEVTKFNEIIQ